MMNKASLHLGAQSQVQDRQIQPLQYNVLDTNNA